MSLLLIYRAALELFLQDSSKMQSHKATMKLVRVKDIGGKENNTCTYNSHSVHLYIDRIC